MRRVPNTPLSQTVPRPLVIAVALACAGCHQSVAAPAVPLALSVEARLVDGAPLPVYIQERPGFGAFFTSYVLQLSPDGFWKAEGYRYPSTATIADTTFFRDNGHYSFDGTSLVLHSNSQHTDWVGTARVDTLTLTGVLAIANSAHTLVLWPTTQ